MNIYPLGMVALAIAMPVLASELIAPEPVGAPIVGPASGDYIVNSCAIRMIGEEPVLTATVQGMPVHSDIVIGAGPGAGPHVRGGGMVQKGREGAIAVAQAARAGAGGGPHVKVFDGVAFTVASSPGGGMPQVTAMAINTKGTGANNGRMLLPAVQKIRESAARPSSGATASLACTPGYSEARASPPVASCSVSGNPDAPDVTFSMPLSAFGDARTGHVSLIKRSADGAMRATATYADGSSFVATCDSKKGSDLIATYDLKMAKK